MAMTSLSAWATVATASLPSSVTQLRSLYSIYASRLINRFISRGTNTTSPVVPRICLAHHKMLTSSNLIVTKKSQNDAAIFKQANVQCINKAERTAKLCAQPYLYTVHFQSSP